MVSETFFSTYFWTIYVWFVIGVVAIGVPALVQIIRFIRQKPPADEKPADQTSK